MTNTIKRKKSSYIQINCQQLYTIRFVDFKYNQDFSLFD